MGSEMCIRDRFSTASHGRIIARSLWAETKEVIEKVQPRFCFLENVGGARKNIAKWQKDLKSIGYGTSSIELAASDIGAPHRRLRLWIIGNANYKSKPISSFNAKMEKLPKPERVCAGPWTAETLARALGVADGMAHRMDRFRVIGNGQVPLCAAIVWRILSQLA